jgi:hypothetical protein
MTPPIKMSRRTNVVRRGSFNAVADWRAYSRLTLQDQLLVLLRAVPKSVPSRSVPW